MPESVVVAAPASSIEVADVTLYGEKMKLSSGCRASSARPNAVFAAEASATS